jgi:hypothetical protein
MKSKKKIQIFKTKVDIQKEMTDHFIIFGELDVKIKGMK